MRFFLLWDSILIFMTHKFKKIPKTALLIVLYLSLPIFLFSTNPQHLPIVFLIVPYLLLFLIIYVSIYYLLGGYFRHNSSESKARQVIIAGIGSAVPVVLILLASIRQFTIWDIVLSIAIVLFISWYLLKANFFG